MSTTETAPTILDTWGFETILAAGVDNGRDLPAETMSAINAAARDRGIHPGRPSDALDLSRDLIITDALAPAPWSIVGTALCVAYDGVPLAAVEEVATEESAP